MACAVMSTGTLLYTFHSLLFFVSQAKTMNPLLRPLNDLAFLHTLHPVASRRYLRINAVFFSFFVTTFLFLFNSRYNAVRSRDSAGGWDGAGFATGG